jgi:hypothetical protein
LRMYAICACVVMWPCACSVWPFSPPSPRSDSASKLQCLIALSSIAWYYARHNLLEQLPCHRHCLVLYSACHSRTAKCCVAAIAHSRHHTARKSELPPTHSPTHLLALILTRCSSSVLLYRTVCLFRWFGGDIHVAVTRSHVAVT